MNPPSRLLLGAALSVLLLPAPAEAGRRRPPAHEPAGALTFTSPQSSPLALSPDGSLLLVAATTTGRVDVVSTATHTVTATVTVGLDPVSIAFKPDGSEAWVANHVSDSVSVIDTDPASSSFLRVVETIQDLDANGATLFDEPVGIAFAGNSKAYVALSSRNEIAVVDATNYAVSGSLNIRAQDPRAIAVANGRLYVAAFESSNQTELSGCAVFFPDGTEQCTFTILDFAQFVTNPNVPGAIKNIVIDPQVPDRDLFVFDTSNDSEIKVTSGVGTLLYGLAVDASDRVYVTQTDALNHVNGITGPPAFRTDPNNDGDVNLRDLDNRLFLNEIAVLNCAGGGSSCSTVSTVDLDPGFPDPGTALATPYGVALSQDGSVLVATAAGTNRVFTMSSAGTILDRLTVGAIPRGVAFASTGATGTAYVLNTLDNTVSVVGVGPGGVLSPGPTIDVGLDPTPDAVRRGRIAFNNAFASTSGTFSCGSCHPDGHTDQLLWRIGGECFLGGCVADEDEPRSTMPVRGLRDTIPLHWDGTLGDPFGGGNGSGANPGANCSPGDPHSCFRQLSDAGLSGVMCEQPCANGPSGLPGLLTAQERDDMATFLERVSYPPARARPVDDDLTTSAVLGFEDFFMDQNGGGGVDTCADSNAGCHELPLGAATNSETLAGFDAPTMRGLNDRFLQFSLGTTAPEELLAASGGTPPWNPSQGYQELVTFAAAFPNVFTPVYGVGPANIFQMIEEASTGHSGALGRQVTLNTRTTGGGLLAGTEALLAELEAADARGLVNLRGAALRFGFPVTISYLQFTDEYQVGGIKMARSAMIAEAQGGTLLSTLTARLRSGVSEDTSQPLIAPVGAQCGTGTGTSGDPALPTSSSFQFEGAHVVAGDAVFLNGQDTGLTVSVLGSSSSCSSTQGQVTTQLLSVSGLSRTGGTDLLQIRSANGLLSNELPLP